MRKMLEMAVEDAERARAPADRVAGKTTAQKLKDGQYVKNTWRRSQACPVSTPRRDRGDDR
jgi:hypothetical protein